MFPGNTPSGIDYAYMGRQKHELEVLQEHLTIASEIGTEVGIHVYHPPEKPKAPGVVIIFCHGNILPTRYNTEIIQSMLDCGATVVGRDFVGYDRSSRVPNRDGSLELASIANDRAVARWVVRNYPESQIILCGRSIGTFGWANLLEEPQCVGAIGFVPFTSLASVVTIAMEHSTPKGLRSILSTSGVRSKTRSVAKATFPVGCYSELMEEAASNGFNITGFDERIRGKKVVLFPATQDELVPEQAADELKGILEQSGAKVTVSWVEGDHKAVPGTHRIQEAVDHITNSN